MRRILILIVAVITLATVFVYGWRYYLVHQHREAVLIQLKDPDSAKFKNERIEFGWTLKDSILCGEVNSKNGVGGYVGYKEFSASGDTMIVEIASDESQRKLVEDYCGTSD